MSADFIKLLKEKVFEKGNAYVSLSSLKYEDAGKFRINKYFSHDDASEAFLNDLAEDFAKPVEQKNFKFFIHEMKGFKRTSITSFVKKNPSLSEFENVFHSFYKNFGMDDLFNNLHIKSDYNGTVPPNHPYSRYILCLLKQDFKNTPSFSHEKFLDALSFNFKSTDKNYPDLKESIYLFLENHYEKAKAGYCTYYTNQEKRENAFELSIYEKVKKHIKEEDLGYYGKFWSSIAIKEKSNNLFTTPKEEFAIFNLNYSYLTDRYPSLNNSMYAKDACEFVCNFMNESFKEHVKFTITKEENSFTQMVCELKNQNLKKENLQTCILEALQIHEDCKLIKTNYLRNEYKHIYAAGIEKIDQHLKYFILENTVPTKDAVKSPTKKI